ncbi:hypothetical protein DFH27DRAFT_546792 [Peziza echinospora]|nr:hypothetical protein DFH27DRAFT_546792 [Peziza echinospora]
MSASSSTPGTNPPHPSLHGNPMQQLRPLSLPAHTGLNSHSQQFQHITQQHESHIPQYYTQNGGSTPVSAGPGGSTYSPGGSTPIGTYSQHHPHQQQQQQQQQPQTHPGTPTSAVSGGPHHYPGLAGVSSNEYGIGVGVAGGQGGVTTYPPFKRKAIRAAQACDACRARKAKCDEGRPSCGFCKETAIPCVYREVPPPKQDRTLLEILTRLGRIETLLDSQGAPAGNPPPPTYSGRGSIHQSDHGMAALASAATSVAPIIGTSSAQQLNQINSSASGNPARPSPVASYSSVGQSGNLVEQLLEEDDQLTIPYQHTTAAHKLLWWDSIRTLIDEVYAENEGYIMQAEEERGSMRIWGRGENAGSGSPFDENEDPEAAWGMAWDSNEGDWVDGSVRGYDMASEAAFDESEDGSQPKQNLRSSAGGLTSSGTLRLDHETVRAYLDSYLSNIHVLHPILDRGIISRTTKEFVNRVTPPAHYSSPSPFTGHDSSSPPSHPSLSRKPSIPNVTGKRKRSTSNAGQMQPGGPNSSNSGQGRLHPRTSSTSGPPPSRPQAKQRIPRTIHSALVLLVMALGSVCLHRQPIPGPLKPQPASSPKNSYSPSFAQSTAAGTSPPFVPTGTPPGYHTQQNSYLHSQMHPTYRPPQKLLRNVDIIPGLAYYAKATEILGALFGGNELENVQAGLLAGLYWGQLGRVLDSWKWISSASMGCQILVKMKLPQEKDQVRVDLIKRVFWSCMQLESDVLAELDLPPSGLSRLEDTMTLPNGICTKTSDPDVREDDPLMWLYYLAQIALRKLLNRVHTALYKQQIGRNALDTLHSLKIARELDFQLERWKNTLPMDLRWNESDEPSSDINAARLRAKYFGARYIIHRPFVYQVVHGYLMSGSLNYNNGSPSMSVSEVGGSREATPAGRRLNGTDDGKAPPTTSVSASSPSSSPDQSLEASCRKCLEAAVHSTTAFHAFSPSNHRPIITNVFGTAHAQFGNLLVLSAAYRSNELKHLVPSHILSSLFSKTIFFLRTLSPISAALRKDLQILENTAIKLDLKIDTFSTTW